MPRFCRLRRDVSTNRFITPINMRRKRNVVRRRNPDARQTVSSGGARSPPLSRTGISVFQKGLFDLYDAERCIRSETHLRVEFSAPGASDGTGVFDGNPRLFRPHHPVNHGLKSRRLLLDVSLDPLIRAPITADDLINGSRCGDSLPATLAMAALAKPVIVTTAACGIFAPSILSISSITGSSVASQL